jgi:pentatricopeptide repeat protein
VLVAEYAAIIDGYIKHGEHRKALSLLEEAHERGLPRPNQGSTTSRAEIDRGMQKEPTYCRLLEYLLLEPNFDEATELFIGMQQAGVEPTSSSIKTLLKTPASVAYFALPLYESFLSESPKWGMERRADIWKALSQGVMQDVNVLRQMPNLLASHKGVSQELPAYQADLDNLMRAANVPDRP